MWSTIYEHMNSSFGTPAPVFGTESWLHSDIKDHEVFPDGYVVYRKDRKTGRGVFVAVKDTIVSCHMPDFYVDSEMLVKLNIASCKSQYLVSYYRPNANARRA